MAAQGLTAGSGFATEELCCLLLDVMDDLEREVKGTSTALYVDDATVGVDGTRKEVAHKLALAGRILAKGVAAVGLELSCVKSVVMATAQVVARAIARSTKVMGKKVLKVVRHAKVLGCGNAAGNKRDTKVMQDRLKQHVGKKKRVQALRAAGVNTSVWQGVAGNTAMMYGADTSGVSDSLLEKQRCSAAANVSAAGAGKQKDMVLWLADARGGGADPCFAAHELPITALAKAAWERWWTDDEQDSCSHRREHVRGLGWFLWRAVEKVRSCASSPWAVVTGPFTAVAATAARLGWSYLGDLRFLTDTGELLNLAVDSPQAVKLRVRRSTARWRARRIDAQLPFAGLAGLPPVHAGFRAIIKSLPRKDPLADRWVGGCAASLISAAANGQWPQTRLKSAHFTEDARCQLCLSSEGTLCHRRSCPLTAKARGDLSLPKHLAPVFDSLTTEQRKLLLNRGILAPVDLSAHPPGQEDSFGWTVMPEGGLLMPGWTTYLDGSFRDGPTEDLGRTGWGFISYDEEGKIRAAAFGVPPPWIRAIHGAEMWALFAALRCSLPGGQFRSDRKAVVDTFGAGKAQATSAGDEHARLWELIFATCDGADPPQLLWMPAHTSAADVGRARMSNGQFLTTRDRSANDAADTLAKRGAELHRVPKDVRKMVKLRDLLAVWAARTLGIVTHAANHAPCPNGGKPLRDSAGLPRAARRKAVAAAQAADASAAKTSTDAADGPQGDTASAPLHSHSDPQSVVPRSNTQSAERAGDGSSSEEEVLVLEKVGPPPSAHARLEAHRGRRRHTESKHVAHAIRAIESRCNPLRPNPHWLAKAEVVRTLSATAAGGTTADAARGVAATVADDNEGLNHNPGVDAHGDVNTQPALLAAAPGLTSLERRAPRPTRDISTSWSFSCTDARSAVTTRDADAASSSWQSPARPESTVSFRPSECGGQGQVKVSTLQLTALLKLCALDDQGVEVVWPDGLDYVSSLELLDSHDAIDLDEVEAWKLQNGPSPSPPTPAVEDRSSSDGCQSAQTLSDLIELHEDGLPVTWPEGLDLALAKAQLRSLATCGPG